MFVNDAFVGYTETVVDSWFADWEERVAFELIPGSTVRFELIDDDMGSDGLLTDDYVTSCFLDPVTPDNLRSKFFICGDENVDLAFDVEIRPR